MKSAVKGSELFRLYPQFSIGDSSAGLGLVLDAEGLICGSRCSKPWYRRAHVSHRAASPDWARESGRCGRPCLLRSSGVAANGAKSFGGAGKTRQAPSFGRSCAVMTITPESHGRESNVQPLTTRLARVAKIPRV